MVNFNEIHSLKKNCATILPILTEYSSSLAELWVIVPPSSHLQLGRLNASVTGADRSIRSSVVMQTSWKTYNFQLPDFGRIFLVRNPSRLNCSQTFCYRWNCYIHSTININFTSYASFNTLLDFLLMNGHWLLGKGKTGTISILMSVRVAFLEEIFKVIAGPDFTNRICNKKCVKSISVKKEIKMTGTSSVANGPVLKHHRLKSCSTWYFIPVLFPLYWISLLYYSVYYWVSAYLSEMGFLLCVFNVILLSRFGIDQMGFYKTKLVAQSMS